MLTRHVALVAAGVDVTDAAALDVPGGHDGHRGLIVTAEDTGKGVVVAFKVGLELVQLNHIC